MEFIAFLGEDKKNWGQIIALIDKLNFDNAILIQNQNSGDFPKKDKCEIIKVNSDKKLLDLQKEIKEKIKEKLSHEFEATLSIASGNGKEHMALISALLSIPVGIKLVAYTKNGIEYLS